MLPWMMPPSLLGVLSTSLLLLSLPQSTHQSMDEKLFSTYKVMTTKAQGTVMSTEAQNTVRSTEAQSTVASTEAQNTVTSAEAQTTVTSAEAQTTVTNAEAQSTVRSTEAQNNMVRSTEAQTTVTSTEAQSTVRSTEAQNNTVKSTEAQTTVASTEAQSTVTSTEAQSTVTSTEAQSTVTSTEAQSTVTSTEAQSTVRSTEAQSTVRSTEAQSTVTSAEAQSTVISTEATVEDVSSVAVPLRTVCPEGSKIYGSYCYGLFHIPETWYAAELKCQDLPLGHLASLTNEAEASFVAAMIAENGGSWVPIWIGLHNPLKNHRWRWSSKALLTYQAWDRNAPSFNSGFCVNLTQRSGFLRWNNAACKDKFSYICKFIAEKW